MVNTEKTFQALQNLLAGIEFHKVTTTGQTFVGNLSKPDFAMVYRIDPLHQKPYGFLQFRSLGRFIYGYVIRSKFFAVPLLCFLHSNEFLVDHINLGVGADKKTARRHG